VTHICLLRDWVLIWYIHIFLVLVFNIQLYIALFIWRRRKNMSELTIWKKKNIETSQFDFLHWMWQTTNSNIIHKKNAWRIQCNIGTNIIFTIKLSCKFKISAKKKYRRFIKKTSVQITMNETWKCETFFLNDQTFLYTAEIHGNW